MKPGNRAPLPKIVSQAEWEAAHDQLLAKEKVATPARDALASERRRHPMMRIEKASTKLGGGRGRRPGVQAAISHDVRRDGHP
jgi:predicted dithiol-disulfide oxidoreductase (DUF899 family)